jgi:fatty acid desaturase
MNATQVAVPEHKRVQFRQLTQIPDYSWPCISLALVVIGGVITVDVLALAGALPIAAASLLLIPIYYYFFSVMHDAVHRSISRNKALNDGIGRVATFLFAPFASLHLLRWAHMEHHRFTNDEGDPDSWSHGPWWSLPLRWMTIDFYYAWRALTSDNPAVKRVFRESLPILVAGLALIGAIVAAGYGFEFLMLCFIPSRLAFIFIGYSFFWLPHAHWPDPGQELRQSRNYTRATLLRVGHEWLFNPLLQYQNYHLVHHLWPTTPFYNNQRVYQLLEPEFRQRDLAVVHKFETRPRYHNAGESAVQGIATEELVQ